MSEREMSLQISGPAKCSGTLNTGKFVRCPGFTAALMSGEVMVERGRSMRQSDADRGEVGAWTEFVTCPWCDEPLNVIGPVNLHRPDVTVHR